MWYLHIHFVWARSYDFFAMKHLLSGSIDMDMILIHDVDIRNDDIKIWNKNLSEYLILIV